MAKKRDFDAFYYGVGMKLDEASVEKAGEQLEGKLNQVVNNVKNNLQSISEAVNKGVKEIDTKGLVGALVEAQRELGSFNDFNPKELKQQISSLETDFRDLKSTLGDVAESIKGFKDLGGFISDVATRLSNIEIVAPKLGKDALKKDIAEMTKVARGFSEIFASGQKDIPTDALDAYVKKVKDGIASMKASGNDMELFVDGDLAKDLIKVLGVLREMGAPVSSLHSELFNMIHSMRSAFKDAGIIEAFKDIGYQIDEANHSLSLLTSKMKPYEDEIQRLRKLTNDWQNDLAKSDEALLSSFQTKTTTENFDAIIAKIKEYQQTLREIDDPSDVKYQSAMANMLALAQSVEKQMESMGKKKVIPFLTRWSEAFDGNNLEHGNKFSTSYLELYRQDIQDVIDGIKNDDTYKELEGLIIQRQKRLASLMSSKDKSAKAGRPQGTTNKPKKTTDLSQVTGEKFVVSPTLNIKANEWAQTINDALTKLADEGKIKPINFRINTQSKQITDDLNKIRQAIEGTLQGTRNQKRDKDGKQKNSYVTSFDSSFKVFIEKLKQAKTELIQFVDKEWKPKLSEAFKFTMQVDGESKHSAKTQVTAFITSYIDALNQVLENKPVQLRSNIDALIEEIKTKTQNIEIDGGQIDFKVGDVQLPQQNIGNLLLSVDTGDLAKDDTVRKIYNLLSVRKGSGKSPYDDRIAELHRLIAAKEASERKTLGIVETKTGIEQKGAEVVERKVEAESKPPVSSPPESPKPPKTTLPKENPPTKPSEPPKEEENKKAEDKSDFNKQQIYNEVHHSVEQTLKNFKDVNSALDWVKGEAKKYGEVLKNTKEGSEDYFRAQAGLTTLLHQWRSKIGSGKKDNPWRYEQWVGFQGGGRNWSKYLKDFGIKDLFPEDFKLTKETKWREDQGLEKPEEPKNTSSKQKTKQIEETAEEMIARDFEHTKEIAQHVLKLAKWAKALGTIANGIDYTITERDFGDRDTVTRNGTTYTREDLGKNKGRIFSQGDRLTSEALDQFISDYENTEDEEFKELFGLIKTMIEKHRANQERLNSTLKELEGTDVAKQYLDSDNKSEYLSKGIKSSFGRIMAKNGNKDAQSNVQEILSRYGVLDEFKKLSAAKDSDTIEQIMRGLVYRGNFGKLTTDLASVQGNMGKSYDNLVSFMKIFQEFTLGTATLNEIGFEAQKWIRGTTVQQEKYKKEYDPHTGRSTYTNEVIGVENQIIEKGLRQMIQEFRAIFIDEQGNRTLGFNDGQNMVDEFVGGKASFTKIINALERALEVAVDIQTPENKGLTQGYVGVRKHQRVGDMREVEPEYTPGIIKTTEADKAAQQIQYLQQSRKINEEKLQKLRAEMQETISEAENVNKLLGLSAEKDSKITSIAAKKRNIEDVQKDIKILENQLTNPAESFENIVTQLLQKQEALLELQKQYDSMPGDTIKQQEAREKVKKQIKQEEKVIERLQNMASNAQRDYQSGVALNLIEQQSLNVAELEKNLEEKELDENIANKRLELKSLAELKEDIRSQIRAKNQEKEDIKPQLSTEQQNKVVQLEETIAKIDETAIQISNQITELEAKNTASDNDQLVELKKRLERLQINKEGLQSQIKDIQNRPKGEYTQEQIDAKQKIGAEILPLNEQLKSIMEQEEPLQKEVTARDKEIQFLKDTIDFKKKYIESLRNALGTKRVMTTPEEINAQLDSKSQELAQLQKEQDELKAEYATIKTSEEEIVNRELEALRARKAEKEARIKELDATTNLTDEEMKAANAEYMSLGKEIAQIDKYINEGIISIVKRIGGAMRVAQEAINRANENLARQEAQLGEADKTTAVYTKGTKVITRDNAGNLLAQAQERLDYETAQLGKMRGLYENSMISALTEIKARRKEGDSSLELMQLGTDIMGFDGASTSLLAGKITEDEFVDRATKAYMAIQQINGEVNEEIAKTNAKNLASAINNTKQLQEDIKLLKEIISLKAKVTVTEPPVAPKSETKPELPKRETKPQKTEEKPKPVETVEQKKEEEKKTTETKKQESNEEKKTAEVAKQAKFEEKKTAEAQKRNETPLGPTSDVYLDTVGETIESLLGASKKYTTEVQQSRKMFREHGFAIKNGAVVAVSRGTYQMAPGTNNKHSDTYGHAHPRNTQYSAQDFEGIIGRRSGNKNYNTDLLITPDYVHKITNIAKVSVDGLRQIQTMFASVGDAKDTSVALRTAVQESILHHYGKQFGLDYSKNIVDENNQLQDITSSSPMLDKETLDTFLEYITFSGDKSNQSDYSAYKRTIDSYREKLRKNDLYTKLESTKSSEANLENAFMTHGKPLQDAIDQGWDLKLFFQELSSLLDVIKQTGTHVPDGSALQKIIAAVDATNELNVPLDEKAKVMDGIKSELIEFFGYEPNSIPDIRRKKNTYDPKGIQYDWKKAYSGNNKELLDLYMDEESSPSIAALKAELADLEAKRDTDEVDPRFATAENQQIIIELLKSGIKVNGKITAEKVQDSKEPSEKETSKEEKPVKEEKKRVPKIPSTGRVDVQADEINKFSNVNKDSDVYKRYQTLKAQLDDALKAAEEKGDEFTTKDADRIRGLMTNITQLGKKIIDAANAFEQLKARGVESAEYTENSFESLEAEMLKMAHNRALDANALISDISYDDVKQTMTYVLTDLEGQTTRVTQTYNDMFGAIITRADKTTDSVRRIYKAIEGEITKMVESQNLIDTSGKKELGDSKEFKAYSDTYKKMLESANSIRKKGALATKEEKDELIALRKQVETTRMAFEKMVKASNDFDAKVGQDVIGMNNTQTLETQMKNYVLNSQEWSASQRRMIEETWKFNDAQNSASYAVEKNKGQLSSMSVIADVGTKRIGQYTEETKKYKSGMEKFMDSLKNKWQEVARYLMTFGSMYRVFALLKQGITYIKEIDSALTELKKVTDETEEAYERFLNTAAKTADKVGSTIKEVVSSTADWARIGYSLKDAATLAESTAILLNVSEFQSIDEATSALTSTLQAFSYTAEQSMDVVDVLNEVGKIVARR